jgi:hypothetical protein
MLDGVDSIDHGGGMSQTQIEALKKVAAERAYLAEWLLTIVSEFSN